MKTVDCKTLKNWLDNNQAILVDVRTPAEHLSNNIPQANLIPLDQICKSKLPNLENKKLVIHCQKGGRGGTACEKLLAEDPNLEIYNLEGGINAWSEFGQATKSSGKFFLPLDRQVQLTIGFAVFLGSILAYFVSAKFLILTGFFGAGLIFAGLSGSCGLAILMAKCPWNKGQAQTCKIK